jgi:hypothetical protein
LLWLLRARPIAARASTVRGWISVIAHGYLPVEITTRIADQGQLKEALFFSVFDDWPLQLQSSYAKDTPPCHVNPKLMTVPLCTMMSLK